jgi:gluconolactonase
VSACPTNASYGPPIAPNSKPTRVKDGFVFLEGPVWSDRLGVLLFSEMDFNADGRDGPPSTIHQLLPPSTFSIFLENSGSNGLAIDARGLLACTHDTQAVSRVDLSSRRRTVIVPDVEGKHFNSPNDLVESSSGHLYFTDPDWQLGKRRNETGVTGVYWVKLDGRVALVDGTLVKPNGIALSPDERSLYVGSVDGSVWVYAVGDNGQPGPRREFAKVPSPDGMAVDCAGNLYVASHDAGRLQVLSAAGATVASIEVGPRVTNAAFGGADHKTLYITAGSSLYSLAVNVPGYPY